jgi:hypothetical protein
MFRRAQKETCHNSIKRIMTVMCVEYISVVNIENIPSASSGVLPVSLIKSIIGYLPVLNIEMRIQVCCEYDIF